MEISEEKYLDMCATIISGVMANPVNAHMTNNQYDMQISMQNVFVSLENALMSGNITIKINNQ